MVAIQCRNDCLIACEQRFKPYTSLHPARMTTQIKPLNKNPTKFMKSHAQPLQTPWQSIRNPL